MLGPAPAVSAGGGRVGRVCVLTQGRSASRFGSMGGRATLDGWVALNRPAALDGWAGVLGGWAALYASGGTVKGLSDHDA